MKPISEKQLSEGKQLMPTIGIAGVTIPGAIDCINKIARLSRDTFQQYQHPNIKLDQPDFAPIHQAQEQSNWSEVTDRLVASIESLAKSGADFAIIPANTVHIVIKEIQKRSSIPILDMLEIVTAACQRKRLKKVGVLGTKWTMGYHLYKEPFAQKNIIEIVPSSEDQQIIQDVIFSELIPSGAASKETLSALLKVVENLKQQGCDGLILACTELPLVLNTQNCGIEAIDTTAALAEAAIAESMKLAAQ
jgi:aspartate racemase